MLWLLSVLTCAQAANPGIQVSLNNSTLTTAFNLYAGEGLALLEGGYGSYTKDFSYLHLTAHLTLKNITLVTISYNPDHTRIELQAPENLLLYLSNVSVHFHSNYSLHVLTTTTGWADLTSSGSNLTLNLSIGHSDQSHPVFVYNSASLVVGQATFTSDMEHEVQDLVQKEVDKNLPYLESLAPGLLGTLFPMVNELVGNYSLQFEMPLGLKLDLGFVEDAEVVGERVYLPLNGTFFSPSWKNPELQPAEIPDQTATLPEPIQAQVSDYTVNSAIASLWWSLAYSLEQLPPQFPMKMNTDEFTLFIPQLRNHFGANKPLAFFITPNEKAGLPTYMTDGNVSMSAAVNLQIKCNPDTRGWQPAITFTIAVSGNFTAWITNNIGSATILSLELDSIEVASSAIGPIDLSALATFLRAAISGFIPQVNDYLGEVALPLSHILMFSVLQDDVEVETGYLAAGMEIGLELASISL